MSQDVQQAVRMSHKAELLITLVSWGQKPWHWRAWDTSLWQHSAQLWGAGAGKTGKMEEIKSLWQIWQPVDGGLLSERGKGNLILLTQCHKNEGSHRQVGDKLKTYVSVLGRRWASWSCQSSFKAPRYRFSKFVECYWRGEHHSSKWYFPILSFYGALGALSNLVDLFHWVEIWWLQRQKHLVQ